MPPPEFALLPLTVLFISVNMPLPLKIPPPPFEAALPVTVLLVSIGRAEEAVEDACPVLSSGVAAERAVGKH